MKPPFFNSRWIWDDKIELGENTVNRLYLISLPQSDKKDEFYQTWIGYVM